jgi:hypothetical protein
MVVASRLCRISPWDVLGMPFGLAQRGNGAADDLDRQLEQLQCSGEFVWDAMAIVA